MNMYTCLSPSAIQIDMSWEASAELASRVGFDAIELPAGMIDGGQAIASTLHRLQLKAGGWSLPTRQWRGSEDDHQNCLSNLPRQARLMQTLNSGPAFTWLQPFSDARSYRENFAWHVQRLKPMADILGEHDCSLAIEFVGPRSVRAGHRFPFIHTMEQTLELCEALGNNVGLLLDSWHWHTSLSTVEDLRLLTGGQILYVHLNDAPAGVPHDHYQDLSRALPAATGVIDIGAFFHELRQLNYQGAIVAEPFDASLASMPAEQAAERTLNAMHKAASAKAHPVLPQTMKALGIGRKQVRLVDQPTPLPIGNQVIVKLHASLLCGSNMDQFQGEVEKVNGGHEGAGEVVAVAQSNRLRIGDRVALAPMTSCGACRHCLRGDVLLCTQRPAFEGNFAEYTRVADSVCIKLPEDISSEHGALMGCALGPAYGALKAMGIRAYDTLVVTGLGPVGIGVCALATFMNIQTIAVDPVASRREIAGKMGVTTVEDGSIGNLQNLLLCKTGLQGSLFGIDCTGRGEAQRLLIDLATAGGQVVFIGENKNDFILRPSADCIRKQLVIRGIWHMNMNDAPDLITFLRRRPDLADMILTHRFPLACAQQAFDTFANRQGVKVALLP